MKDSDERTQPTESSHTRDPARGEDESEAGPKPLVSRIRAGANFIFLVAGLLFLFGFLLTIALATSLDESHMRLLTHWTAYAGFLSGIAFVTSIISIIIENRTVPHTGPEEKA